MKSNHQITILTVLLALAGCSPSDQTGKENQSSNPAPAADAREQQPDKTLATAPEKEAAPAPPLVANPAPPAPAGLNAPSLAGKPGDSPPATAAPAVPGAEAQPSNASANTPPETRDEFITAMNKKLTDLDAKIAELAQKAEGLKDDAKVQAEQALSTLRTQREQVKQKFDEAKAATSDLWKDFKAGVELAMNQLETAYENAKSKFN